MSASYEDSNTVFINKVDQFIKSCNKHLQTATASNTEKMKDKMLEVARGHKTEVTKRISHAEGLKNLKEVKRLSEYRSALINLIGRLDQYEEEASYFRSVLTNPEISANDETDDDEDDDFEDELTYEDDEEDEEDDEEEEEEGDGEEYGTETETGDEVTESSVRSIQCAAIDNYTSHEPGDLCFKKGDRFLVKSQRRDGWWEAEHLVTGVTGLVPSNYMKVLSLEERKVLGKEQQDILKKVLNDENYEKLRLLGVVNTGSRPSLLVKFLQGGVTYLLSTWLHPRLSPSCVSFKDLHWDVKRNAICPVISVNRIVNLNMVRNMPPPKLNSNIICRRVHMALTTRLTNNRTLLSNIHTVNCTWQPTDPYNWKFIRNNGSLYHPKVLCRIETAEANLGLLIEACCVHAISEKEFAEVCVGWTFVPLFQTNGTSVPNSTQPFHLMGGMSFSGQVVPVDEEWPLRKTFGRPAKPQISVTISAISRFKEQIISMLPSTILLSTLNIKNVTLFRKVLGDTLLREENLNNGVIFSPILSLMLQMSDQPVLMDTFKRVYLERRKTLKRGERKDTKLMRTFIEGILKDLIWPMVVGTSTQYAHDPLTRQQIEERVKLANGVAAEGGLSMFVKDGPHRPFDVAELCYVPIYKECFSSLN